MLMYVCIVFLMYVLTCAFVSHLIFHTHIFYPSMISLPLVLQIILHKALKATQGWKLLCVVLVLVKMINDTPALLYDYPKN